MTDFRTELEHAAQELELAENALLCSSFHNSAIRVKAAARRARAALDQPEPQGPSDQELDEFAIYWWGPETDERLVSDVIEWGGMAAYARAVLARWGRPAIEPVPGVEGADA